MIQHQARNARLNSKPTVIWHFFELGRCDVPDPMPDDVFDLGARPDLVHDRLQPTIANVHDGAGVLARTQDAARKLGQRAVEVLLVPRARYRLPQPLGVDLLPANGLDRVAAL